jgi:type IV pilus assembly protein PilC
MPNYYFEALSETGQRIVDEIAAANVSEAIHQIEARGWDIQLIRAVVQAAEVQVAETRSPLMNRLEESLADRTQLIAALEALASEIGSTTAAKEIHKLVEKLREGATADALVRHESAAAWLPLLVRGVSAQGADGSVLRLLTESSREVEQRRRRRGALIYPVFLLAISLLVVGVLLITVVPIFRSMFADFGLRLPSLTYFVLELSWQLTQRPLRSLAVLVLAVLVTVLAFHLSRRYALATRYLGLVTAGNVTNLTAMARFSSALANMLSLDTPLDEALRIAGRATQHPYFRHVAHELSLDVSRQGGLRDSPIIHSLPANVVRALHVGPNGQPSIALLEELSLLYSDRAEQRFEWSTNLVGPTAVIGVAVMVGFVVVALFMPLVQLITSLT